jgi:hypothetical protein
MVTFCRRVGIGFQLRNLLPLDFFILNTVSLCAQQQQQQQQQQSCSSLVDELT